MLNRIQYFLIALAAAVGMAENSAAETAPSVTYAQHIAPLLHKHCVECHRPGVGAPFDLLTYADAQKRAKLMAKVTASRFMPPWKPEHGHTPLLGERGLRDEEIALFREWAAQGAPEGDATLTPPSPKFPEGGWRLGTPDLVVEMEGAYDVPASGPDTYRNFVLPLPDIPPGTWLKGVEFRASAPQVVHHCLIDLDYSGLGRELDTADPGVGYEAVDQVFEDNRIAAYAVGSLPYFLPDGVAFALKPGGDIILETHFHPTGKPEREHTQVALYLTREAPKREMVHLPLPPTFGLTLALDIPAGEARHTVEHSYTLDYDVNLFHIFPHAHMLCREMKCVANYPDGKEQILIWIKDWDFAWQEQYRFPEGTVLPAGTRLDLTFVYDNSANNPANPHHPPQRVVWGHQTTDEMASMSLSVVPVNPQDAEALREAHFKYQRKQFMQAPVNVLHDVLLAELTRRFDSNHDGRLNLWEMPQVHAYSRKVKELSPGNHAFKLNEIAFRRAVVPELRAKVDRLIRTASLAGITAALAAVAGGIYLWRRRKARRAAS